MHGGWGMYPKQYTSRIRTARAKQEEEANTRLIAREQSEIWESGDEEEKFQTRPNYRAEDLSIELPEGQEKLSLLNQMNIKKIMYICVEVN